MMKKYTILSLLLLLPLIGAQAQKIGINTELPLNDLHLNGTLQVTKDFNVGGSDTTKGNSGKNGQILISKGSDKAPEWTSLSIPIVPPGSFSLVNSTVLIDTKGVELLRKATKRRYIENERIDAKPPSDDPNAIWHILTELTTQIEIKRTKNKVNLILQTMGHLSDVDVADNSIPKFTYAIGFFINGNLKSVKPFGVEGDLNSFEVATLVSTLDDLPIGKHLLQVAVIPRLKSGYKQNSNNVDISRAVLAVGRPNKDSTNLSSFMTNTSLQIDVLEVLN